MGFKHSPLPFILDGNFIEDIESGTVGHICEKITVTYLPMSDLDLANAEFIVRACNSHYELLDLAYTARQKYMKLLSEAAVRPVSNKSDIDFLKNKLTMINAVIAKAENK